MRAFLRSCSKNSINPTTNDSRQQAAMQRHQRQSLLALLGLALLLAVVDAFVPAPVPAATIQRRQQQWGASPVAAAAQRPEPGQEAAEGRRASVEGSVGFWLRRAWTLVAPLGVMVALPLAGAPMRAGAAFDVEGIAQALKEDTSKKYSDEGLGLVETLKKRSVQNKAKNDREIMEKTFLNSEAGIYGPFDKFVPVMKKDGQYVLLAEDEYNRLKGEGKIVGRDFVVDYQGDSAPAAVTEEAPAKDSGEEAPKSMLDDDADLLDGLEDAELL